MTRINSTGISGPQPIASQDSASQNVSTTQKTQQEPGAAEQQQSKQAAQARKSEIDLQGTIKQSELAQFHGPGRSRMAGGRMDPCNALPAADEHGDNDLKLQDAAEAVVAGAVAGGPAGALLGSVIGGVPQPHGEMREAVILDQQMKEFDEMINTKDPISGKTIVELEAPKDDEQKAKELLNAKNLMSPE